MDNTLSDSPQEWKYCRFCEYFERDSDIEAVKRGLDRGYCHQFDTIMFDHSARHHLCIGYEEKKKMNKIKVEVVFKLYNGTMAVPFTFDFLCDATEFIHIITAHSDTEILNIVLKKEKVVLEKENVEKNEERI